MPAHEFDQADTVSRRNRLDAGTVNDIDRSRISAHETEAAIDEWHIVVDGLGHADDADSKSSSGYLSAQGQGTMHAAVATEHEEDTDAVGLQVVDHLAGILRASRGAQHRAAFVMDAGDRFRCQHHRLMTVSCDQTFIAISETDNVPHAVAGPQFEHDATDDIVQARGQSAAGHDAAAQGSRIEKNLVARPGQFKSRKAGCVGDRLAQARD